MKVVHKFRNKKSRCKDEHGRKCRLTYARRNWVPSDKDGISARIACHANNGTGER